MLWLIAWPRWAQAQTVIVELLLKRDYIVRQRKNVEAGKLAFGWAV